MKHLITFVLFFITCDSLAQNKLLYEPPPSGKSRLFFLRDFYHPRARTIDLSKRPIFINEKLILLLKDKRYTYIDIEPGTFVLSTQPFGKKYNTARAEKRVITAQEGSIYYFEVTDDLFDALSHTSFIVDRTARKFEIIINTKRTKHLKYSNLKN